MLKIFNDSKKFFPGFFHIVLPIVIQRLFTSSLNFIDVFMIGQLGENEVAAVGIGNQIFFVYMMLTYGLITGISIFSSQFWGKKDIRNIRSIAGIGLKITLTIAFLYCAFCLIFPDLMISIYTKDMVVKALAKEYLEIILFSFIIYSTNLLFVIICRSTQNVKLPMITSIIGVLLNTIMNYLLIYGKFGFPELGIRGAAIATLIARIVEFSLVLLNVYMRKLPGALQLTDLLTLEKKLLKEYIKKTVPIVLQTSGWSIGNTIYSAVIGHVGIDAFSAYNVAISVERLFKILFDSLALAASIMIGNRIGAGEEEKATGYSRNFLIINFLFSIVITIVILLIREPVSGIYQVSNIVKENISNILLVMSIFICAKGINCILNMGILKAGGDTKYSMILDLSCVWFIGIPFALLSGFVFKFPVYFVVAFIYLEEVVKAFWGYRRFLSGKWLNNLVRS